MIRINKISRNISSLLIGILSICLVLFSCEVEEVSPKTDLDKQETEFATKNIDESVIYKSITLNSAISAQKVFYTENKIVVSALKQSNTNNLELLPTYLLVNSNLELIREIESAEEIEEELDSFLSLGDSVLAFSSEENSKLLFYQYKTTDDNESKVSKNSAYFSYSSGFVYKRELCRGFCLDYYNESFEKLWTKTFENTNTTKSKYIFNLNNSLFYISFDCKTDKVYIEKFKNPCVVLNKNSFALSACANNREELFAISNSAANSIMFAAYNIDEDKTRIYIINEDCAFDSLNTIEGRFEGIPQFCTIDGSIIVTDKNSITKYNANWEIINEREFSNPISGVCAISDNLNLIYQNLPSGEIRLSYLDKHLNSVVF